MVSFQASFVFHTLFRLQSFVRRVVRSPLDALDSCGQA